MTTSCKTKSAEILCIGRRFAEDNEDNAVSSSSAVFGSVTSRRFAIVLTRELCWWPGLMRSDVPRAEHRLVALARLEAFVRYAKVLQARCFREPVFGNSAA